MDTDFLKVLDLLKKDISTLKTGRADPGLIEGALIEAYGLKMKLIELATISVLDSQTLIITPFDMSNLQNIAKGLESANLGLSITPDDAVIRAKIPMLTTERREEMVKMLHQKLESGRIMARQVRAEKMKQIAKEAGDNEDEKKRREKELQNEVDKVTDEIKAIGEAKKTELRQI